MGGNYVGPSLSGVQGQNSRDLAATETNWVLAPITWTQVLSPNPLRHAAIFGNRNASADDIVIAFSSGANGQRVYQYGFFQIDKNIPWTGAVWAYMNSPVNTGSLDVTEISGQ